MKTPWLDSEINLLKEHYPAKGGVYCSEILNRPNKQVRVKANSLGLFSPKNKIKTTEQYLEDLITADLDVFPIEEYVTNSTAILHEGYCGHQWKATPNRILSGKTGCPTCATHGIDLTRPTTLYLVSFVDSDITYYKLGITNNTSKTRYLGEWNKLSMKEEWSIALESGHVAKCLEQELLQANSCFLINTGLLNAGNTETLSVYVERPNVK